MNDNMSMFYFSGIFFVAFEYAASMTRKKELKIKKNHFLSSFECDQKFNLELANATKHKLFILFHFVLTSFCLIWFSIGSVQLTHVQLCNHFFKW